MNSTPKKRRFWLVTLAAVLSFSITLALGFWQLGRANAKLSRQALIEQQSALATLDATALSHGKNAADSLYRKVELSGRWLAQHSVYLDNRQMDGKPGLILLTPFEVVRPPGERTVILVQRGWVARNFLNREKVPEIKTTSGETRITGQLAPSPSRLYEFKGEDKGLIRQNVSISELASEFRLPLYELSLLQTDSAATPGDSEGLKRHWPAPNLGVEKHYGYMVQWWALSCLIMVLYIWLQIFRPRMTSKRSSQHEKPV